MHEAADRLGDLSSDPTGLPGAGDRIATSFHDQHDLQRDPEHDDEVWFEADELAAASSIEIGGPIDSEIDGKIDSPLGRASVLEALDAAIATPGISLAQLPGWPEAGPMGQGLGPIGEALIGELRPGDLVLLSAAERGVGRTSLLAQLGDGLALAAAGPDRPLTPVLCAIEGSPALWRARSLARFTGVDARVFVDGQRARREPERAAWIAAFARGSWAELDARQRFVELGALADPRRRPPILAGLRRWQDQLGEREGAGAVWPIMIVDPIEQLTGGPDRLIDAVQMLAELAANSKLIVLASCDLGDAEAAWARILDGFASVRLRATALDEHTLGLELCHRRLGPRGHGRLRWHRPSGRFEADPPR